MVEKAQKEVEVMIKEEGESAVLEVGVHGVHPELVKLLGKLKFRTSYGPVSYTHLDVYKRQPLWFLCLFP